MHLSAQKFNRNENQQQRKEQMIKELDLSETQAAEMEEEREKLHNMIKEVRENDDLNSEEKREQVGLLMEDHRSNLEKILTEEQLIKLDELRPKITKADNPKRNFRAGLNGKDSARFALLLEKRKEFNIELSDEEKEVIEKHRNEVEAKVQERREECRFSLEEGKSQGMMNRDGEDKGSGKGRRMDRGMMKELDFEWMDEVTKIAEVHSDEISSILLELKPEEAKMNARRSGKRKFNSKSGEGNCMEDRGQMMAVRFLLLDPADEPMEVQNENILNIYPNPARSVLNIEYDVPKPGDVKIELLDRNGNMIETVDHRFRDSGFHHLTLDINDLESNEIYFIQLTDQSHKNVIKFVKL